jgi:hypothetical protein
MCGAGRVLSALGLFCVAMAGRAANLDRMRLPLRFEENVGQADPMATYTNPLLTPGVSVIRASDLQQIRAALR